MGTKGNLRSHADRKEMWLGNVVSVKDGVLGCTPYIVTDNGYCMESWIKLA